MDKTINYDALNQDDLIKTITTMFEEFESKMSRMLSAKMNTMSNSFMFIEKALENSGIITNSVDKQKIEWQTDIKNMIYELVKINQKEFPTYQSVMTKIAIRLRNVYGVVIEQLKKEYKEKYGLDRAPSTLDAISEYEDVKKVFESILESLFPDDYWESDKDSNVTSLPKQKTQEEIVVDIIRPLAEKYQDTTKGYNRTFRLVYDSMDCAWSNLQIRYKNQNHLKTLPRKMIVVANNPRVFKKFKKCVENMLDETI